MYLLVRYYNARSYHDSKKLDHHEYIRRLCSQLVVIMSQ
jgi:hypothetical protein